jgi:hypothetical protein
VIYWWPLIWIIAVHRLGGIYQSASVAQTAVHDHTASRCSWANVTAATWPSRLFVEVAEAFLVPPSWHSVLQSSSTDQYFWESQR